MHAEIDADADEDTDVARAKARRNFEQLKENFPPELMERKDGLASEMAALPGSPMRRLRVLYAAVADLSDAVAPSALQPLGPASLAHLVSWLPSCNNHYTCAACHCFITWTAPSKSSSAAA